MSFKPVVVALFVAIVLGGAWYFVRSPGPSSLSSEPSLATSSGISTTGGGATPSPKTPAVSLQNCATKTTEVLKMNCYVAAAMAERNASLCDKLLSVLTTNAAGARDFCYKQVAEKYKDSSLCARINSRDPRDLCYLAVAFNTLQTPLCEKVELPDQKEECYLKIALYTKDLGLCSKLQTQSRKYACQSMDPAHLKNLTQCEIAYKADAEKDGCYANIAKERYDASFCSVVLDESKKSACYTTIAKLKKDPKVCFAITNQTEREQCILNVGI